MQQSQTNAAAVMTDAVGFSVLAVAKIVLMQQLAVIMSFWMLTIGLSGILVPVICSLVPTDPKKLTACEPEEAGWLGRLNMWLANFSIGSGKAFIGLVAVAIVGVGVWQVTNLKVSLDTYNGVFTLIAEWAIGLGIVLLLLSWPLKKWMHGVK